MKRLCAIHKHDQPTNDSISSLSLKNEEWRYSEQKQRSRQQL